MRLGPLSWAMMVSANDFVVAVLTLGLYREKSPNL